MNRDELLTECFGTADLKAGQSILEMTQGRDVRSHVDLSYRRVIVSLPGQIGQETILVAAIANVCTDPAFRRQGFASSLVRRAHTEATEHPQIRYAALWSDDTAFFARLGYRQVAPERHPAFLVAQLRADPWPPGPFDTKGEW